MSAFFGTCVFGYVCDVEVENRVIATETADSLRTSLMRKAAIAWPLAETHWEAHVGCAPGVPLGVGGEQFTGLNKGRANPSRLLQRSAQEGRGSIQGGSCIG